MSNTAAFTQGSFGICDGSSYVGEDKVADESRSFTFDEGFHLNFAKSKLFRINCQLAAANDIN